MGQHSVFFCLYASLDADQSLLLKASALYFDKLFILDLVGASWDTIGTDHTRETLRRLREVWVEL